MRLNCSGAGYLYSIGYHGDLPALRQLANPLILLCGTGPWMTKFGTKFGTMPEKSLDLKNHMTFNVRYKFHVPNS